MKKIYSQIILLAKKIIKPRKSTKKSIKKYISALKQITIECFEIWIIIKKLLGLKKLKLKKNFLKTAVRQILKYIFSEIFAYKLR
jgi:hypothetical protein